mmetsp:Transcript_5033/g.12561  ORF Transcript_5033/g.12561 Transcript_5033/m.12561 type:complete len:217 (+) Transcript_5033:325-975(+)
MAAKPLAPRMPLHCLQRKHSLCHDLSSARIISMGYTALSHLAHLGTLEKHIVAGRARAAGAVACCACWARGDTTGLLRSCVPAVCFSAGAFTTPAMNAGRAVAFLTVTSSGMTGALLSTVSAWCSSGGDLVMESRKPLRSTFLICTLSSINGLLASCTSAESTCCKILRSTISTELRFTSRLRALILALAKKTLRSMWLTVTSSSILGELLSTVSM